MTIQTKDPVWLATARKYVNQKEVPGKNSNLWILKLWESVPWIWTTVANKDDSLLAWCGAFVRFVMIENGIAPPKKWWSASSWDTWGSPVKEPVLGCIGVMKRSGGGHVTIIVGIDNAGNYLGLGGNQGDSVKISAFPAERFTKFVWPNGHPLRIVPLPNLSAELSSSEA